MKLHTRLRIVSEWEQVRTGARDSCRSSCAQCARTRSAASGGRSARGAGFLPLELCAVLSDSAGRAWRQSARGAGFLPLELCAVRSDSVGMAAGPQGAPDPCHSSCARCSRTLPPASGGRSARGAGFLPLELCAVLSDLVGSEWHEVRTGAGFLPLVRGSRTLPAASGGRSARGAGSLPLELCAVLSDSAGRSSCARCSPESVGSASGGESAPGAGFLPLTHAAARVATCGRTAGCLESVTSGRPGMACRARRGLRRPQDRRVLRRESRR